MKCHSGEREHKCNECEKDFYSIALLRRHLKTHTDDRPYQCPYCEKAFRAAWILKRHIETHAKLKDEILIH